MRRRPTIGLALAAVILASASCSLKRLAINKIGDALAESGTTFASDDDPELVGDALPFSLKLVESILAQNPKHRGLLLAAAGGFTQYAYAYVQEQADEIEDHDVAAASRLRQRAKRLYLRARGYALRGLELERPGMEAALRASPAVAAARAEPEDLPFLYWTAASWGGAISTSKDDPDLIADLPIVGALLQRALEIDETYEGGSIHDLLITYEGGRSEAMGGSAERARAHFEKAVALSGGQRAAPYLDLAETVSIKNQDRSEFTGLLDKALKIDPEVRPEWRLSNLIMQRRARWLLERADLIFVE